MAEARTATEPGHDGTALAVHRWPANGPAWATVLLVHGLGEHAGRHSRTAEGLAAAGLEVHAYDQRGFGASAGRRAYVTSWSELHADLATRLHAVRAAHPNLPTVLFGHSLGGLVALGAVLEGVARPDLLVLSAPAIGADLPAVKRIAAQVLGRIAPTLEIPNGLDGPALSSDPAVGVAYAVDRLNHHRTTARFGMLGLAAQRRALDMLDRLAIPTLVVHGGDDRVVPTRSSEPLAEIPGVTRLVYDGQRHELHNEPVRELVLRDVIDWIRATIDGQLKTASGERNSAESVARPLTRGT